MNDSINGCDTTFRWVQQIPVGELKSLEHRQLDNIRQRLIKEVREVGRALQWVDGIVRIKLDEESRSGE